MNKKGKYVAVPKAFFSKSGLIFQKVLDLEDQKYFTQFGNENAYKLD